MARTVTLLKAGHQHSDADIAAAAEWFQEQPLKTQLEIIKAAEAGHEIVIEKVLADEEEIPTRSGRAATEALQQIYKKEDEMSDPIAAFVGIAKSALADGQCGHQNEMGGDHQKSARARHPDLTPARALLEFSEICPGFVDDQRFAGSAGRENGWPQYQPASGIHGSNSAPGRPADARSGGGRWRRGRRRSSQPLTGCVSGSTNYSPRAITAHPS